MDVVAYLRILRRHWRMVVVAGLLGALLGAGSTLLAKDSTAKGGTFYKATHTLFLDTSYTGDIRPVFTNLDQMAVLVVTGDVPQDVAGAIGGDPKDLVTHIFVTTNGTLSTIDITAAAPTQQEAVQVADAFADKLVASIQSKEESRAEQLQADTIKTLNELQAQIAALDAQIAVTPVDQRSLITAQRNSAVNRYTTTYERFQTLAANVGISTSPLSTLQAAEAVPIGRGEYDARITAGQLGNNRVRADLIPDGTENPLEASESSSTGNVSSPFARGVIGAIIGLLIGVGMALVAERIDRRIRSREEFEAAYGMPVLAEVPLLKASEQRSFELTAHTGPFSRAAEAYRALRSSLLFQRPQSGGQLSTKALTIMVASATPKEGKSTTSANLAAVFAESGQRVLVMNCDFRRPTLHRFFDVENEPRHVLDTGIDGLMLVSDVSGPDNPNPAHATEQQRRIITNSQEHFEVLILDTAPLLSTNDATELMDLVDLVVVVGRMGQSTSDNAMRVRELLSRLDAPAAGVVMVGSDAATNEYYYYYSRGRAKELHRDEPTAATPKTKSKSKEGTTGNGTNGNGSTMTPVAEPETTDG